MNPFTLGFLIAWIIERFTESDRRERARKRAIFQARQQLAKIRAEAEAAAAEVRTKFAEAQIPTFDVQVIDKGEGKLSVHYRVQPDEYMERANEIVNNVFIAHGLIKGDQASAPALNERGSAVPRFFIFTPGSEVHGPYDSPQLKALEECGTITKETVFCREGEQEWNQLPI